MVLDLRKTVILSAIAMIALSLWQASGQLDIAAEMQRIEVVRSVSALRERLENALSSRLAVANSLSDVVAVDPEISQDDFRLYATAAMKRLPSVRSIQLAKDAVVSHVHPLIGNEAAIGHDLLQDPRRRAAVELAIQERSLILAGPVELRQGGTAVIGRVPVFVGEDDGRFWGMATVVIDLMPLLADTGLLDAQDELDLAIRGRDGKGAEGDVFFGDLSVVGDNPVIADILFNGGSWQLMARPVGGWSLIGDNTGVIRALTFQCGLLLAFLIAIFVFLRRVESEPGRLRRAVVDARRQLQAALDTISEGFAYYDANDRLVTFNKNYVKFYGASAPVIQEGARFEDVIRFGAEHGQYALDGRTVDEMVAERVSQHRNPQGTLLQQLGDGRWIQVSERRMPDGGIAGIRTDVTALKRVENELRETNETLEQKVRERVAELDAVAEELRAEVQSKTLLAAVVDAIPSGVTISDARNPDNPLIYCNPGFTDLTGYTMADIDGKNCRFLTGEGTDADARRRIRESVQAGEAVRLEILNYRKSGEAFWNDLSVFPVRDSDGAISNFVGVQMDATGRRAAADEQDRMERQLMEARKFEALGTLAGGIAHEINTPVQYLSDNLSFLKTSFEDLVPVLDACRAVVEAEGTEAREQAVSRLGQTLEDVDYEFLQEELPSAAAQSIEGAERIAQIVRAVREFSHPSERQEMEIDVNAAIETALTVTRNQWKYHAEVETVLSGANPVILGNAGEFNQVVVNLIVNAAQAIEDQRRPDLGTIVVSTRCGDGAVELEISDDGPGIPEEIRSKVFEPFFTTKEPGRGTGQGLAISDAIVRKHGGEMSVAPGAEAGTVFTLRFRAVGQERGGEKAGD